MAQHGSPGIHAGRPTAQNLLSASRRGGQIKSSARRGGRPAGLVGGLHSRSVVADEPCEAALGLVSHCDVAVVKSASSVNQAYRVYWFCDRCALDRSLVLLVSGYNTELLANPVDAAVVKPCTGVFFYAGCNRQPNTFNTSQPSRSSSAAAVARCLRSTESACCNSRLESVSISWVAASMRATALA